MHEVRLVRGLVRVGLQIIPQFYNSFLGSSSLSLLILSFFVNFISRISLLLSLFELFLSCSSLTWWAVEDTMEDGRTPYLGYYVAANNEGSQKKIRREKKMRNTNK